MRAPLFLSAMLATTSMFAADPAPRSLDPRLKIELFAEHPQIVTPTGIDIDRKGRVWAIESNTHFRPENYQGHPTDRVLVMTDTDNDRRADNIVVFADGLTHTMSIAVKPVWLDLVDQRLAASQRDARPPLSAFLATRDAIWLLHDDDGDFRADRKQRLVHLDTPGDYPHNGLGGFAFDALGWMYFGFGENLGAEYRIIGSDGTTLSGGGEGGNLYRCRPDGTQLSRWATGFWNPHASCVDAFGRLFTVDNDPDSRPPCRLLHVIPGGDYGYRFRNGRKGLHPFTSWNGEIPGTLPMVAGTGEAPSGIVAYESGGLPDDYLGTLLVTSWGDHRIDRFRLEPQGASFTSRAEPIVVGGQDFRPVGLALAPDGSLYCTDWVLRDYKLHGKGRVWRISAVKEPEREVIDSAAIAEEQLAKQLESPRIDLRRTAAAQLSTTAQGRKELRERIGSPSERLEIEAFYALARVPRDVEIIGVQEGPIDDPFLVKIRSANTLAAYLRALRDGAPQVEDLSAARMTNAMLTGYVLAGEANENAFADPSLHAISLQASAPWLAPSSFVHVDESTPEEDRFDFHRSVERFDEFTFAALIQAMSASPDVHSEDTAKQMARLDFPRVRLAFLLSSRLRNPKEQAPLRWGLRDPDPWVRRAAVQWAAEENLTGFRAHIEAVLNSEPMTPDLFLATLAALSMLDGVPPAEFEKQPPAEYILPILRDGNRPPAIRAIALRLLPPDTKQVDANLLRDLLQTESPDLKLETVRTLQGISGDWAADLLRNVAADDQNDEQLRAGAVVGLASHRNEQTRQLLRQLITSSRSPWGLRTEAIRALRGTAADDEAVRDALLEEGRKLQLVGAVTPEVRENADQLALALDGLDAELPWGITNYRSKRPETSEQWLEFLSDGGDPEAGRRVFFHPNSAGCSKCHTVHARGGKVGPDLSVIARTMDRRKLAESILEPSKEISPQFTGWTFVMTSGKVHTGLVVGEGPGDTFHIGTPEGEVFVIKEKDIEQRLPQTVSIMPDKLEERLTPGEFRDLLAFLETLK